MAAQFAQGLEAWQMLRRQFGNRLEPIERGEQMHQQIGQDQPGPDLDFWRDEDDLF